MNHLPALKTATTPDDPIRPERTLMMAVLHFAVMDYHAIISKGRKSRFGCKEIVRRYRLNTEASRLNHFFFEEESERPFSLSYICQAVFPDEPTMRDHIRASLKSEAFLRNGEFVYLRGREAKIGKSRRRRAA